MFTGPFTTKSTLRRGDTHLGVWSLQRALNVVYPEARMVTDGAFGQNTEMWAKRYQADVKIYVDGIVGPQTQNRMVRSMIVRGEYGSKLPRGLLEGQISLESAGIFTALNASVAGGVDLGLVQMRVYGPPYDAERVRHAMDPFKAISDSAEDLYQRAETYRTRHPSCPFNRWELAVLHHNWPVAAGQYAKNGRLTSPNNIATWAPAALGTMTWEEWCFFYVARVCKDVVW
jgi:peptidoglycan hydrolase-like protein with peptidoglycan-binding domain